MRQGDDDIRFLWYPGVPVGGKVLLNGPPSAGKSQWLWQLLDAVQRGGTAFNSPTAQGNALLLSIDMPEIALRGRWRERGFAPTFDVVTGDAVNVISPRWKHTPEYAMLKQAATTKPYALVGIDAVAEVHGSSAIRDDLPALVYGAFQELFPGAAVLYIHHDRKRKVTDLGTYSQRGDEDALGTQYWKGLATVTMHLYATAEFLVEWVHTKSQVSVQEEPVTLLREESGWLSVWDTALINSLASQFEGYLLIAKVKGIRAEKELKTMWERVSVEQAAAGTTNPVTLPQLRRLYFAWASSRL